MAFDNVIHDSYVGFDNFLSDSDTGVGQWGRSFVKNAGELGISAAKAVGADEVARKANIGKRAIEKVSDEYSSGDNGSTLRKVNRFVADMIADPLNAVPLGVGAKATKLSKAVLDNTKLMAVAAPAMTVAKEYGDDTKSGSDMAKDAALSSVFGAILGGGLGAVGYGAGKLVDKLKKPKTSGETTTITKAETTPVSNELADGAEISLSDIKPSSAPDKKIDIDSFIKDKPESEFVSKVTEARAKALDKTPEELASSHPVNVEKLDNVSGKEFVKENPEALAQALKVDKDKTPAWASDTFEQMQQHPAYREVRRGGGDIGVFDASKMSDDELVKLFDASKSLKGDVNAYTVFDNTIPDTLAKEASVEFGRDISGAKFAVRVDELIKNQKHSEFDSYQTANQLRNSLDGFKFDGIKDGKLSFSRDFGDAKVFVGFDYMPKQNLLTLKTLYSDTGILPTALVKPKASNSLMSTQGSLPAKEILTKQSEDVNIVVKGMFEKLGDKYVIRLFKDSDMTTIVHETAHYLEQTFDDAERAVYSKVFGVFDEGVKRSEAFAEGFVRWVADEKSVLPELQSIFTKFKELILSTFKAIPDSAEVNFKLTDEMKLFYKAILGDAEAKSTLQKAIEKEAPTSQDGVRLFQTAQPEPKDTPLFIRPTADMKGSWTRWVDGVYDSAVALLNHPKLNDVKFVRQIREQALLSADRSELHIDSISEFRMRLTSQYDKASELGKDIAAKLNPKERETLTRLLENEQDEATKLLSQDDVDANKVAAMYKNVRMSIDQNADTLVRFGALDEKDKINDYVKRIYQEQLDEAKAVFGGVFGGNTTARRGVEKTYTVSDPIGDNHFFGEYIGIGEHTYKVESVERLADGKARLSLWRDYTLNERKDMGQVSDAAFVVAYTMQRQAEQIEKARLLQKLAKSETKEFENDKVAQQAGYVKLDNNKQTFGALANKYVPNTLEHDIDFYLRTSQNSGIAANAVRALEELVGRVKIYKTVANPSTHFGNIMSNILLTTIDSPRAFGYMFDKEIYKEAQKTGLFAGTGGLGDIERLREVIGVAAADSATDVKNKLSLFVTKAVKNALIEPNTLFGDAMRNLYALEDNLFKAAYYGHYKAKYKAEGLPDDMASKYAIAETIDRTIDFTKPLPPLIRRLDNTGITPFLSFAVRSTPTITKAALRNPLSLSAFLGIGWGLFGSDDKSEAAKPVYAKGSHNLLFVPDYFTISGDDGKNTYFNIGRLIPGFRYNPVDWAVRQLNSDPSDNGGQIFDNLGFLGSFINIINGKDGRTGMSFLHEDKKSGTTYEGVFERAGKTLWMAWREFAPNYLGKTPQQFMDASGGEKTDRLTGELVTPGSVALSALIGKTVVVDVDRAADESKEKLKDVLKHRVDGYLDGTLSKKEMIAWAASDVKKAGVLNDRPDLTLKDGALIALAERTLQGEVNTLRQKAMKGNITQDELEAAKAKLRRRIASFRELKEAD